MTDQPDKTSAGLLADEQQVLARVIEEEALVSIFKTRSDTEAERHRAKVELIAKAARAIALKKTAILREAVVRRVLEAREEEHG